MDASVDDVFVRFDACAAGRFTLVRRSAEIVFVLDRSGSMIAPLEMTPMGGGPTRWVAMRSVLINQLARYENNIDMGALFYPRVPLDGVPGARQYCDLMPMGVDVTPARNNAETITSVFLRSNPGGATPTGAAVRRATQYLRSRESRGRAQYLVIATDGGPNCNERVDPRTCSCTDGVPPPDNQCNILGNGPLFCLDDEGSVQAVREAAAQGIQSYVIGIDGDIVRSDPAAVTVLNNMALAGGRPRSEPGPRYYSIQNVPALESAFGTIQRTIAQCAFVTPSRPDDPNAIDVEWNGARVPRDESRRDGWDWTDAGYGEMTFFGPTCDRFIASPGEISATVRCQPR